VGGIPNRSPGFAEAVMRLFRCVPSIAAAAALLLAAGGCGSSSGAGGAQAPPTVTLYTSATQNTVDAVVAGYQAANPGAKVDVFRATTGALNTRIAADQRSGGLRADVMWGTDPLSMRSLADQHLLKPWPLPDLPDVPAQYKTEFFWGTRVLHVVIVAAKGLTPAPKRWSDLTQPAYRGAVAIPDPTVAGSAFAALGYFSQQPSYGVDFYRRLKANGAVQVSAPAEVVTAVAQGRSKVGITLESEVRGAAAKGSPIDLVWPADGAIAVYSPIAVTATTGHAAEAEAFVRYVLSADGQAKIAGTGWQPVLPGVPGPPKPAGATIVHPDWPALFGTQKDLLARYQTIFGG
jgi:iron(III) transport system substrate-binding protein